MGSSRWQGGGGGGSLDRVWFSKQVEDALLISASKCVALLSQVQNTNKSFCFM